MPQTHALNQRYGDSDLYCLTDSTHSEWTGCKFQYMLPVNNTVLADMPTYVTSSVNNPSFLVVTPLLPGRTLPIHTKRQPVTKVTK
jgi:hypothetical protein